MEWNSALGSFIYVHLPLRPVTMSLKDLCYATCRLYSQVSSVVSRFFCLSLFKIAETIITMLIGLICEISLPSGLLFYTLFSTLLGAAMKPCPSRTRATASCVCCFGFCFFFLGGLAVRRCWPGSFLCLHIKSLKLIVYADMYRANTNRDTCWV